MMHEVRRFGPRFLLTKVCTAPSPFGHPYGFFPTTRPVPFRRSTGPRLRRQRSAGWFRCRGTKTFPEEIEAGGVDGFRVVQNTCGRCPPFFGRWGCKDLANPPCSLQELCGAFKTGFKLPGSWGLLPSHSS